MSQPPPLGPIPPVLVGRKKEQQTLNACLVSSLSSQGRVVLIGGEVGIGKTTLARQLCGDANRQGVLVLSGHADLLAESPPYGPWVEMISRAPKIDSRVSPPTFGAADDRTPNLAALFAQVRDYIAELSTQQPTVLLLEDFHWADPASVDLLRFIARDVSDLRLLVLVTYRADELTRHHPLALQIPGLVRQANAVRIDLRHLERDDMRALIASRYVLKPQDEERLIDYLEQRAEGNPLYIEEILRALEMEQVLARSDTSGDWNLGALSDVRVPALLRQIIDERVVRLGAETYDLLSVAAVIGPDVKLSVWSAVSDVAEEDLIDVVETAVEARLLDASPDGTSVGFVHAMIREALYEGILPPRRRLRHRKVAETLLDTTNPDPDSVAYHLHRAGDPRAAKWLIRAGSRAQRSYALLTAADRFDAALELLETQSASDVERAELMYRIARMRRYADPRESLHYLDDAISVASSAGDDMLTAYMRCFRGGLLCAVGELRRGLEEMESGLGRIAALTSDERQRLRVLQERLGEPIDEYQYRGTFANWLAVSGRAVEAISEGNRVVAMEPAHGVGTSGYANAWRALASANALLGVPDEARRACAMASSEYRSVEHPYQFGNSRLLELFEVVLPFQADHLEERRRLAQEAEEAWTRASGATVDLPPRFAWLPLKVIEGDWREARELAESARSPSRRRGWRPFATTMLTIIATHQGDSDHAWRLIREQLPSGPDTLPGDGIVLDVVPLKHLAVKLSLDGDDLDTARAWLESSDRWLEWSGAVLGRAEGHLAWASYLRSAGRLDEAISRATQAFDAASDPRQPLSLLAAQRLLGEIETSAGQYESAAQWLDRALTLADACLARYERGLTLLASAELDRARGSGISNATLAEAKEILDDLGAQPALARLERIASSNRASPQRLPAGLTAREMDVLRLVAEGRTDREIADALFISPRTVTTHISRILAKLDVGSRTAAASLALREGIV